MRLIPLCLLAFMLTGCVREYRPIGPLVHSQPAREQPRKTTARPASVKIYASASELVSKPFRDLGEVTGDDCQSSRQDSPPNLATARKRLQVRAANMSANAVLLHQCEIVSTTPGCYRQAICQGSALKVN